MKRQGLVGLVGKIRRDISHRAKDCRRRHFSRSSRHDSRGESRLRSRDSLFVVHGLSLKILSLLFIAISRCPPSGKITEELTRLRCLFVRSLFVSYRYDVAATAAAATREE